MKRPGILAVGVVLVAVAAAWIALGSSSGEPGSPPFTATDSEVKAECLTGTYVPEMAGWKLAEEAPPRAWRVVEAAKDAMQGERGAALVTIRGHGDEGDLTLTGIKFDIHHFALRPVGTVFYRPCERRLRGPAIEADLDGSVGVVDSSAAADGELGVGFHLPRDRRPIRFPWTVSLEKPLRIYLVVDAEHSYADWSARIFWESDSAEGVIRADNGGRKYRVVDGLATSWYKPGPNGRWIYPGSARWIGVK
jgi:hypothetical protein